MKTNNLNLSVVNIPAPIFEQIWNAAIQNAPKKIDLVPSETIDLDWNDLPDTGQKLIAETLVAMTVSVAFIHYEKQHGI